MIRPRSPNYPLFSLEEAVKLGEIFIKKQMDNTNFSRDEFFAAINSQSGSAKKKLAALQYYGILENGPEKKLKVSNDFRRLMIDETLDENKKKGLLQKFALRPPVFQKLWTEKKGTDQGALASFLRVTHEPAFSQKAAEITAKNYLANLDYSGLKHTESDDALLSDVSVDELPEEKALSEISEDTSDTSSSALIEQSLDQVRSNNVGMNELISGKGSLDGSFEYCILYKGEPTGKELRRMIARLKEFIEDFEEKKQAPPLQIEDKNGGNRDESVY